MVPSSSSVPWLLRQKPCTAYHWSCLPVWPPSTRDVPVLTSPPPCFFSPNQSMDLLAQTHGHSAHDPRGSIRSRALPWPRRRNDRHAFADGDGERQGNFTVASFYLSCCCWSMATKRSAGRIDGTNPGLEALNHPWPWEGGPALPCSMRIRITQSIMLVCVRGHGHCAAPNPYPMVVDVPKALMMHSSNLCKLHRCLLVLKLIRPYYYTPNRSTLSVRDTNSSY